MYSYGLLKDGGEVIEGVTLHMRHTSDDEMEMMGSILSKNHKGHDKYGVYMDKIRAKADKIRPNWAKNKARRRLASQGATEIRLFPVEDEV